MSNTDKNTDETSPGLFPIRTVSQLTGVNAITLRAWESRHGLIEPIRKSSGHRLYTQDDIDLINRVVGLLDRGMRISQVKAELSSADNVTSEQGGDSRDIWHSSINSMISAIIRFDEQGLERVYGEMLSHYPVRMVTEKLLSPLLRELGERWASSRGSIAEEHFFGFYLRNKLGARYHHRVQQQSGPILLLACLPKDTHEVGLLLFGLAAADAGYQTVLLGANMPLEEIPAAAKKTGCDAVVLSGLIQPEKSILDTQMPKLVSSLSVPVFVGGAFTASNFDSLTKSGAHTVGTDIDTGIKQISEELGYNQVDI